MAAPELVPLGTLTIGVGESLRINDGPIGTRVVAPLTSMELVGERITASLASPAAADWLTLNGDRTMGTVDVRATLRTSDDAIVHVEYGGRIDFGTGSVVSAPLFETGAEQYAWLNHIQAIAVGHGQPGTVVYELYEVRPQPNL